MSNDDSEAIPLSLQPKGLKRLMRYSDLSQLCSLADRGIVLNTWQTNELVLGGRRYGKTFLEMVRIAEDGLEDGISILEDESTKHLELKSYLSVFKLFLEKYYVDDYIITKHLSNKLVAIPKRKIAKQTKKWWKI